MKPLLLKVKNRVYPVSSFQHAQELLCSLRDASDEGVSTFGDGRIYEEGKRNFVARVSYNGRLWSPRGELLAEAPPPKRSNPRRRKRGGRRNPSRETPRIYVANLAAYNAGTLKGAWIEPSSDAEELAQQIADAIGGNVDRDEWAFHDYDGFPDMGEHPSLEDVAAMVELLEEHPYYVVKAAQGFAGDDMAELKKWLDEGYGTYESETQYAEEFVDGIGGLEQLDRQTLENHFDWDSFTREVLDGRYSVRTPEGLLVFNK